MSDMQLGMVEAKFADIIWENAPVSSSTLVKIAEEQLGWKTTTTYTVIKRLSDRGVMKNENMIVTSLISKDEAQAAEIDEFVEEKFEGSLPAFIAAFGKRQSLSDAEIEEIRRIIER